MRRVVVTGLGCLSPCGSDVPTTWAAVCAGRSGVGPITRFDTTGWRTRIAGEVKGFDPTALIDRRAGRRLELFQQYAVVAAEEALKDAGFTRGEPLGDRAGVYIGSGIGGVGEIAAGSLSVNARGEKGVGPFFIPRSLTNLAGGHLAIRWGMRGPSLCVSTACATGNHSIGEGARVIRAGDADVVIAGGSEGAICALGMAGFSVMRALSRNNDHPEGASRPFDRDRDGFVMGEGAGMLVLESLEHARARGARIYAELVGYGLNNDAHHITAPPPGHAGAARCMELALRSARMRPEEIDYINAHGTSTPRNDAEETVAIKAVFGDHARDLAISSTKSVMGHLLGAAGGVEAVVAVKTIAEGVVPPTANLDNPDPECDLDYVPGAARQEPVRAVLSNAFGFGGTNAVLVFRQLTSLKPAHDPG